MRLKGRNLLSFLHKHFLIPYFLKSLIAFHSITRTDEEALKGRMPLILLMSFIDLHPRKLFLSSEFPFPIADWMAKLIDGSKIVIQGHPVHTPDGSKEYKGFWVRDFTMLCESGMASIDADFMKHGLDLIFENQGPNGEIPDWIPYDPEKPVIYYLFGKHHFLDNPLWLVRLMGLYLETSRDFEYFNKNEQKLFAGLNSEFLLDRSKNAVIIDPGTNRVDWGFSDCIMKTGIVLFSSLLKADAVRTLAKIYEWKDQHEKSRAFSEIISRIVSELEPLYDPDSKLYYSASGFGHQIDIWGNAFAVYLGILPREREKSIAESLYAHRNQFVWNGQIRHLLKEKYWDHFLPGAEFLKRARNTYQNGAYWGTPVAWMAVAFEKVRAGLGKQLLYDLFSYYQKNGIYECIHPPKWWWGKIYKKCPWYVASLALPCRLLQF